MITKQELQAIREKTRYFQTKAFGEVVEGENHLWPVAVLAVERGAKVKVEGKLIWFGYDPDSKRWNNRVDKAYKDVIEKLGESSIQSYLDTLETEGPNILKRFKWEERSTTTFIDYAASSHSVSQITLYTLVNSQTADIPSFPHLQSVRKLFAGDAN